MSWAELLAAELDEELDAALDETADETALDEDAEDEAALELGAAPDEQPAATTSANAQADTERANFRARAGFMPDPFLSRMASWYHDTARTAAQPRRIRTGTSASK